MLRRSCVVAAGPFTVQYVSRNEMPRPCTPRWDLKLAKARLWDETVDPTDKAAWQLEDLRHMTPEYDQFVGHSIRRMRPGEEGERTAQYNFEKKLPHHGAHELMARRDVPYNDNVKWGKRLHDETLYGTSVPYSYAMFKEIQKGHRNDKRLKQNKFRIVCGAGVKNPPSGFSRIPDEGEEEE